MSTAPEPVSRLLHRELILLLALSLLGAAAFLFTRWFADANASMHRQDARAWSQRGRAALASGDTASAISALRRALRMNPADRDSGLRLAGAYAAAGQDQAAKQLLVELRDAKPDDVQ